MSSFWSVFLAGPSGLDGVVLGQLFSHFAVLSLLAVGGANAVVSDVQRVVVAEQHWLTEAQFTASVALAQAAPGPNLLFIAVIGYRVAGVAGVVAAMVGMMLPSSLLAISVSRWSERNRDSRGLRAFTTGLAPMTIGLLLSTGWVLLAPLRSDIARTGWWSQAPALLLLAGVVLAMWRTKWSPLWAIAAGGVAGALGWV